MQEQGVSEMGTIGPRYTQEQRAELSEARREVRMATREIAEALAAGNPFAEKLIAYRAAIRQRIKDIQQATQQKAQG